MNGTQVYDNFTSGSSQSLQAAAQAVQQLAAEYEQEAEAIRSLQTRMNAAWTGSSGDAAYAGANPLAQAFQDSHAPLELTNASMSVQSDQFENARAKVVPVPPAPDKPSGWSTVLKSAIPIVGPSLAVSDIKSYQEGVEKTNAANANNVRVMEQYSSATGDTRGKIPMDYKILPADTASIGLQSASVGSIGSGVTSGYRPPSSVGSTMGTASVSSPRTGSNGGGPVSSSGPTGGGSIRQVTPKTPGVSGSTSGTGGTGSSAFTPGGTNTTSERTSRNTSSTGGRSGNSAANRLFNADDENTSRRGGGTTSRGGSAAEERLGRGGSAAEGRGGSAAERLARGAAGSSGEGRLGAGKGSGASNFGSAAAAEEAAASRSAARSANGTPMGAAGQRGRGEEDEEHQRPDYLIEPDPDSIFGTDVRTTPPVIGE
ncbi:uncharacterized protein YukE [Amycolatopsis bartoniae]|uniref:PPE domain-containing protein n=1 Tax=Amycolatopsis bartoniae TaxID=941986 RepID=A0A8H9MD42_9PSEU|nr:PPE domain-containing protein [Amycolatopsis bartoniae]MBB2934224.1 uncharacterized protein YukE [Amycolatopsis bartoniae]GHF48978.1 hypothetical protein GCM10017566_22880 [Amycolatopsis bartoniae]